jgi:hypothetical protein
VIGTSDPTHLRLIRNHFLSCPIQFIIHPILSFDALQSGLLRAWLIKR